MKRFLPIFAVCALLLPALQPARGADASINLFYDNLSGGNWYEVSDYGYVWQPDVASSSSWRPYTDGYWAYTDQGWTWVSYEDFGWATYHYGRWARLTDYGWVWVPGTEWAPAWVSWRTGGDYVGWAPLPPTGGGEVVDESRPITGHVDVEFGIGPAYYNFVDIRYIGEPVLRDRIFDYNRNVTIISNTVNVTNITYNNSTVYNYGPDYARMSAYSVRPIQRLKLERQNVDALQAVRNGNITKVQGNQLLVAAPMRLQKASGQMAPKQVKAKIEQPKVEKGWSDVRDPAEKAKLEQKFKSENAKNVPKPNLQPKNANAAANVGANGGAAAGVAVAASPAERAGKGKRKNQKLESAPSVAPAPTAAASPKATQPARGGKNRIRAEGGQAGAAVPPSGQTETQTPNARAEDGNGKHNKANRDEQNPAPARGGAGNNAGNQRNEPNAKPENLNRNAVQARPIERRPAAENGQPGRQNEERVRGNEEQAKGQAQRREQEERRREGMGNGQPAIQGEAAGGNGGPGRDRGQAERQQQGQSDRVGKEKAKAKKNEAVPTPTPQ